MKTELTKEDAYSGVFEKLHRQVTLTEGASYPLFPIFLLDFSVFGNITDIRKLSMF